MTKCKETSKLKREMPPNSANVFEIRVYKNQYSVVKGYFRLKAVEKPSFHKVYGIKTTLSAR